MVPNLESVKNLGVLHEDVLKKLKRSKDEKEEDWKRVQDEMENNWKFVKLIKDE